VPSLIWINGPFGGGKSSTAKTLVGNLGGAVLFDPEHVGFLLREILPVPTGDFQDLPEWRDLWVRTASALIDHGSDVVVMPMAVHRREYFEEVVRELRDTGACVHHIVLDASEATLNRRIAQDGTEPRRAQEWRAAKISQFTDARNWLLPAADLTVATDDLSIDQVVAEIEQFLTAW
jgi:AAA domain